MLSPTLALVLVLAAQVAVEVWPAGDEPLPLKPGLRMGVPVRLDNTGSTDVEGRVRAYVDEDPGPGRRAGTCYLRELRLPAHSARTVHLPMAVGEGSAEVVLELETADGMATRLERRSRAAGYDVAVLSTNPAVGLALQGTRAGALASEAVHAHLLEPEALPERAADLAWLQAMVLAGADLDRIGGPRREALEGWVRAGGQLLACYDGNPHGYARSFLEPLLPVRVEGEGTLESPGAIVAACLPAPPAPAGVVSMARVSPRPGARILLGDDGSPLAVEARRGAGRVTYLALDPTRAPLAGWAGSGPLLAGLLSTSPPDRRDLDAWALARAPTDLVPEAPGFLAVGAILALYILLQGPGLLVVARGRGRGVPMAAAAILAAVFAAGFLAWGVLRRGERPSARRLLAVRTSAGERWAHALEYVALYAPRGGDFALVGDGWVVPGPVQAGPAQGLEVDVAQGAETLRWRGVDVGACRVLRRDVPVDLGGSVEGTLETDGARLRGRLRNGTGHVLEGVVLRAAGATVSLGVLPRGEVREVDEEAAPPWEGRPALPPWGTGGGEAYLVARCLGLAPSLVAEPALDIAEGEAWLRVDLELGLSSGPVAVREVAFVPSRVLAQEGSGVEVDRYNRGLRLLGGSTTLEFRVPPPGRRAPGRLAIRADAPGGATGPVFETWDLGEGRWVSTKGEIPAAALGSDGRVRVRLTRDESGPVPAFEAVHLIYEGGPCGP